MKLHEIGLKQNQIDIDLNHLEKIEPDDDDLVEVGSLLNSNILVFKKE